MRLFTAEERGITAVTVIVYEIMMTQSFSHGSMTIKKQNKKCFFMKTYYLTEELITADMRNTKFRDISTENILL